MREDFFLSEGAPVRFMSTNAYLSIIGVLDAFDQENIRLFGRNTRHVYGRLLGYFRLTGGFFAL